ncbi:fused response regulator/phosphatase [Pseudooceanicola sediminis]|uniref:Fused response regulator/phosphatase n=1 Tax=Pseudooceanicola sediminis TaxID=2211117 RepID=A0A399J4U5_9RHOB|nr:fused response regulator/phosphatase [Pseudooceanicola sediminis]KAA2315430.1 fused response regulator/phosphatase [Puniceibacterium sp. HSS470]RII40364.1 fused response regulator/phosphatase [Pseudooceanicola sediminis]|tara:strand:+ start:60497 stop:61744 length:1248 start_codon:yes stop_codon:yes gene_type:complete
MDGRQAVDPPLRRVLVVDDSRLQRRVLATLLGGWGFEVHEADGGEEALALCHSVNPDLVISDWMMPGMDGISFCKAFRQIPREHYGYFILLTSKADKTDAAAGLDAGADDFLTKPVNKAELRARLNAGERILDMQRQLTEKNRIIRQTVDKLQAAHDSIDSDLIEAKKLQQSLVRERYRDFGLAKVSLLLRSAGRVGGDLVGYYPINARCFGCFAIDVSGHGITSALMTARLAGYLSSAVPEHNVAIQALGDGSYVPRPLAEVARHLNDLVLSEVRTEHYFTMVLAHVSLIDGSVRLVQAGHPHPVVQRANGTIEEIGQGGVPVGLLPDVTFEEVAVTLEPGDRLLIQSDGIVECPDASGALLGEKGLFEFLNDLRDVAGAPLLEAILWKLGDYAGADEFPDDISAVLVEYQGHT